MFVYSQIPHSVNWYFFSHTNDINGTSAGECGCRHNDVIKWKRFPRHWLFVRGIYRSPVNSPHKGQWHGALMVSLICAWINAWLNIREAGDLRRHRAHYDIIVMGIGVGTFRHLTTSLVVCSSSEAAKRHMNFSLFTQPYLLNCNHDCAIQ